MIPQVSDSGVETELSFVMAKAAVAAVAAAAELRPKAACLALIARAPASSLPPSLPPSVPQSLTTLAKHEGEEESAPAPAPAPVAASSSNTSH